MALNNVAYIWIIAILFCEMSFMDAGVSHPRIINNFKETSRGFKKSTKMFYDEYCPNGDSDPNKTEFTCISYCWWNGFQGGRCTETNFCLCDWQGLLDEFNIPRTNLSEKPNIETHESKPSDETQIRINAKCDISFGSSTSTKTQNQSKKDLEKPENIPNKFSHNNTNIKNTDKSQLSKITSNHSKIENSKKNREHKYNRNETAAQTHKKPGVKNDTISEKTNNHRYSRRKTNNNQYNRTKTSNGNHRISRLNHIRNLTKAYKTEKPKENLSDTKKNAKLGIMENNTEREAIVSKTKHRNTGARLNINNSESKANRTIENSNEIRKIYNEHNTTNTKYNKTKEFVMDELFQIAEVLKSKTSKNYTIKKNNRPKIS